MSNEVGGNNRPTKNDFVKLFDCQPSADELAKLENPALKDKEKGKPDSKQSNVPPANSRKISEFFRKSSEMEQTKRAPSTKPAPPDHEK